MKIRIIWTGKTKEKYLLEGIERYLKLLRPMANVSIIEIKEHKGRGREDNMWEEGTKILKHTGSFTLLDQTGKEYTSPELANFLQQKTGHDFVIGGPYGVSGEIRGKAESVMSLSRMTFTHEMIRVFFLEQIFRAMTIIHGREYHH
ncbi:MAG: 23S rRNA (pseudouridine(1915)-N(3))-methyltransferase RlmH [Nitrospirae bacterium]|nr:23S rRNA (pseudouridine(1915)-N(3))-methyltransferase RlmH [Nitrospirota bacterium]